MKNLFSISLVYRKYWKNFLLILSLIFLGSATGIAFPFGIRYLFNHIVVQKALNVIPLFLLIMILIFILRAISTVYKEKLSSNLANTIITDIREKLFQKGLRANIELIEKKGASQLSSLLLSDIQSLDDMIQNGFILGISSLIMSFLFLSALLFIHLPLAIVSFAAVLPFLYFFMKLHNAIKSKAIKTRRVTAGLNAFFTETMSILSTIRLHSLEDLFTSKQKRLNSSLCRNLLQQKMKQGVFSSLAYFCFSLSFIIALTYSAILAISGKLSMGDLMAFYIILQGLFQPLMSLFVSFRSIQKGTAILERINEFSHEIEEANIPKEPLPQPEQIVINNDVAIKTVDLTFSYNEHPVFKDINMEIKKGEKVLIVGLNGTGKSTLIKLFTGIFSSYEGQIYILGTNARSYDMDAISSMISVVEQGNHVFSGSLRMNIDPGKKTSAASFLNFLQRFQISKNGKHKLVVEDGGRNFSGGEKQRIAIMRSLLKDNADIYIFDEAFSNQDIISVNLLLEFIQNLSPTKTFIGITHQLSIAPFVDNIFLLDNGTIAEQGSHKELLLRKKLYCDLYSLYIHENEKKPYKEPVS